MIHRKQKDGKSVKPQDSKDSSAVNKILKKIPPEMFHYIFVHNILRDWALFETRDFLKVCGVIGLNKSENVFRKSWLDFGGNRKLIKRGTFKIEFLNKGKYMSIIAIKMPKTGMIRDASWVAIKPGIGKTFYTLEKTEKAGYALCAWLIGRNGKPEHHYIKDNLKNRFSHFIQAIIDTRK
jgi:hypothetical protein